MALVRSYSPRLRATIKSAPVLVVAALVLEPHAPRAALAARASFPAVERIAINDNRTAAGVLRNGILTIRLEARSGEWHPDRDSEPGVVVHAFAEEGKAAQIPGPLIRVPEGTEIRASVRNALVNDTLTLHGLYPRGAARGETSDTIQVKPNEVREVRFVAGAPGTYYYWGAPNADPQLERRRGASTQLAGAFIVVPRGAPSRPERVLVITAWGDSTAAFAAGLPRVFRIVVNGKSWPHTERMTYQLGDTVRMRVINAGAAVHPMHLHGFYFNVDSRGNEQADSVYGPTASPRLVVTERLAPRRSFTLTWLPTRPGNWLFHCHDNSHIVRPGPLDGSPAPRSAGHHVENHAMEMMGGPVLGIQVKTRGSARAEPERGPRRRLRLVAGVDSGSTDAEPAYGYALYDAAHVTPAAPPYSSAPTIVLKRGEPVSITVINELPEATSVHWHGIELESYFDGVAGFSGATGRVSPGIAPRDSFEARFTPPRSGTFIYHTHIDEVRQQQAGLAGALIVVDDPSRYDPSTDLVMLVTVPRLDSQANVVLLNGAATPAPHEMRVGTTYRLRFINAHTFRPSMIMKIMRDSTLMTWRAVAKDGMDLPADQTMMRRSAQQMGNGETYDFAFTPTEPGNLRVDVTTGAGVLLVSMPVRVR